jgi:hypothetical protein
MQSFFAELGGMVWVSSRPVRQPLFASPGMTDTHLRTTSMLSMRVPAGLAHRKPRSYGYADALDYSRPANAGHTYTNGNNSYPSDHSARHKIALKFHGAFCKTNSALYKAIRG